MPSTTVSARHPQAVTADTAALPSGREWRCAPALAVAVATAAWATRSGGPGVWVWLAAFLGNVALRLALVSRFAQAPVPAAVRRLYFGSHAADIVLWTVLFAALGHLATPSAPGAAFAAAGAALLGALTLGGRQGLGPAILAGWAAVAVVLMARVGASAALPFAAWLAAVGWMSWHTRAGAAARAAHPAQARQARVGWSTAIGAMPTPVLIVRHGRIADVNAAAAQCFARDELALIGRRIEACVKVDPAHALDPLRAPRDSDAVTVTPILAGAPAQPWIARVRVLEPGKETSTLVVALLRHAASADELAQEAKRFATGVGGQQARPWYCDEAGHLVVPPGLPMPPVAIDERAFPLAYCVAPQERPRVDEAWLAARSGASPFDQRVTLVDARGALRSARIVAVARGRRAVIGAIAPPSSFEPRGADASLAELARQLPVLVWLVDPTGRVVYAHGAEPWRWGMQRAPQERPLWFEAFALRNGARVDVQTALQKAAAGKPTYDLINSRSTTNGGRIVLRSHFVPYRGAPPPGMDYAGTLVLDTIAAPQQLAEIDRLRRSKAQYRALVEASTSLIWACDAQFRFTFVSRRAAREIYGYEPEELIGESLAKLFPPGVDPAPAKQALAQLRLGKTLRDVEMVHAAKNGSRLVVSLSAVPTKASDGGFGGAIGMNADLTLLKLRERRLTEALRIERTVLDSAGQAIAVVKDGVVARCNDAFLRLLGAEPAKLARTPLADYFAAVDEWATIAAAADAARAQDRAATREVQIRRGSRAAGQVSAWCQLTARAIAPGEYVIVLADIDHIRQRVEEALHDAHHDELTGLGNRRLLTARAASAFAAAALRNGRCALFVIDLDGFKEINDRHGHDVGDRVLREIAARLARAMRPQDTVARRGGDEFAVLVSDAGQRADTERIAQRLLAAIAQPIEVPGAPASVVSASIGIALVPDHGRDLERLLQVADLAMYDAKLRGKNRYAFAADAGGVIDPAAPRAAQA